MIPQSGSAWKQPSIGWAGLVLFRRPRRECQRQSPRLRQTRWLHPRLRGHQHHSRVRQSRLLHLRLWQARRRHPRLRSHRRPCRRSRQSAQRQHPRSRSIPRQAQRPPLWRRLRPHTQGRHPRSPSPMAKAHRLPHRSWSSPRQTRQLSLPLLPKRRRAQLLHRWSWRLPRQAQILHPRLRGASSCPSRPRLASWSFLPRSSPSRLRLASGRLRSRLRASRPRLASGRPRSRPRPSRPRLASCRSRARRRSSRPRPASRRPALLARTCPLLHRLPSHFRTTPSNPRRLPGLILISWLVTRRRRLRRQHPRLRGLRPGRHQ